MAIGTNGPPVLNGSAYVYPRKTLYQLRRSIIRRLGYSAQVDSPPPGMNELVDEFLQDAHEQLWYRYRQLRQQRWWTIAITQGNRHYDIPYDGAYIEANDIAIVAGTPDTITSGGSLVDAGFTSGMVVNISGSDADDGYHTLGTVSAGSMNLTTNNTVTGQAVGDLIRVAEEDFEVLDIREITYVGLLDGTIFECMTAGIDPLLFNIDGQQRPTHYEIREFVEVFPEPDQAYTMYLKGPTALKPFTADAHVTSTDPHPVFLQALAQAKAHYGQNDASIYFQQLENMLGKLNADSFGNKRFIPNPTVHVPSLPKPKVTFSRP